MKIKNMLLLSGAVLFTALPSYSIGAAYGGQESWAGNVGVTFSIGGKRKK